MLTNYTVNGTDLANVMLSNVFFESYQLWGWGAATSGALGNSTSTPNVSSPVQTVSSGNIWRLPAAGGAYSASIRVDGSLWLWGAATNGALGDASVTSKSSPVQTNVGTSVWRQISVSTDTHTAALKTDGTLWLWGTGTNGQLGDNSLTSKSSPVQTVTGGSNWLQVSTGNGFTGAVKTDGTLWMWGDPTNGRLGDNTNTTNKSSPVQTVAGGTDWRQVSCGNTHAGAVKNDGTLWLWGRNNTGQLGDNSAVDKSSPVQTVAGGSNWVQVACGLEFTVALKNDGTVWVWGRNDFGQLATNNQTQVSSPVQTVAGGTDWMSVTTGPGASHAGGIKLDGTLWLWGRNNSGQLGDNSAVDKSSPVQTVASGSNWRVVACGDSHTFAVKTI